MGTVAVAPERGLSGEEATRRLAAEGANEVAPAPPPSVWRRVARQLADPLIVLLLASAVVTAALGDVADTLVILLVVVVNTGIGVLQEVRADRAITALHQLAAPTARVVRDGADRVVPAATVVRGDLIVLAPGDIVPADAEVIDARQLRLEEAALTGESMPVSRDTGDEVHAGTVVLAGRARAIVRRTGADSALGRITTLVTATRSGPTPLQRRLASLGRMLGGVAVGLSMLVMVLGVIAGQPLERMAITAVSLVVAAVPESLPAVITLALAMGAYRMAKGHAIARRLHAVETLGAVTVIASDKTGTVTEGRMAVDRAVTPDGATYRLVGRGYDPAGQVHGSDGPSAVPPALERLARAAVLCNDAHLAAPSAAHAEWRAVGDPVEAALVAFAGRCGLDPAAERARAPRLAEEPFEASTRRMVTLHSTSDGRWLLVVKGAPEVVLSPDAVDCEPPVRTRLGHEAHRLADAGLRVLAIAAAVVDSPVLAIPPNGLRPLGLVGIGDPIRDGAAEVAVELEGAGIRLLMITGDHPATAVAIADRMGIWRDGDTVARGDEDLTAAAAGARVFARTHPEQKLDIVAALQARGDVVAMTGDGVNDAPALRRADIGVAMGRGGTEVARQAADLVLTDDNLATIAVAVREGRRIYDNIRRFLRYGLSGGVAELAVMLLGPLLGLPLPLLPAQILWINLLTHGVPGVALGAEPTESGVMRRPPRSPQSSVLGGGLAVGALLIGATIAAVVLTVAVGAGAAAPWQSMAFVTLGLAQLGVALAVRAPRRRGQPGNPALGWAVAVSAALQLGGVAVAPLRTLLGTQPLSLRQVGVCVAAAAVPGVAVALIRRVRGRGLG